MAIKNTVSSVFDPHSLIVNLELFSIAAYSVCSNKPCYPGYRCGAIHQEDEVAWACTHRVGGNQKRYQQSTNTDQKSIGKVFSIAICRQCGEKWQSKTLFLTIFNLHSSILLAFSIAPTRCDVDHSRGWMPMKRRGWAEDNQLAKENAGGCGKKLQSEAWYGFSGPSKQFLSGEGVF